jgi:stress-induced morphogen
MMDEADVKQLVEKAFPGDVVHVTDMTGTRDHFEIKVVSKRFEGLSLVERHKMLHRILDGPMQGDIHAVKLKTLTPGAAS